MKKSFLPFFLFSFSSFLFSQNYTQYVNPFIGTGGHGHTYPGAALPHGMVQLSPDTRIDGSWDGCSGYHYSDSIIYGFSHTHLSGTGISDYGDIMLMPVTKKLSAHAPLEYCSRFNHSTEIAEPGFYSTKLEDHNVTVNLTATERTGFHQYIFHENEKAMVVLDLYHRDELLDGEIKVINNHTVSGYRYSKAWAQNQKVFYYIEFSRDFVDIDAILMTNYFLLGKTEGKTINFFFDLKKNDTLLVKVGISGVSSDGAKLNLQTENPGWNFDAIKEKAKDAWNKELGKIEVVCENKSDYEIFYTALYHTAIVPNIYNDVNGKYRGRDDKIHTKEDGNYYTVFSLWDTFRAAHPLYTLIDQERTKDYIETFILQFQQSGRLPVWELSSNETDCMIGIHSISVIADAITKGLVDDKYKKVLVDAMIATSNLIDYKGIGFMNVQNYLTIENESESVSKTLEYCYQYSCMEEICRRAGEEQAAYQLERISLGYKNLFNPDTTFFVPRSNGGWLPNFDPTEVNNNYTEANAWQYAFFVPHDITGMIELYGGKEKFHAKLDSMFGTSSKMTGREQPDITGLIGQYAHGNEPSHHVAYLYNYVWDFNSTNKIVSKICNEFYTNKPDGLCGNEDCGAMSAWYVLSALGLYQVNPGSPYYTFAIPQVLSAKINLENGKEILIKRDPGNNVNAIKWNGDVYRRLYISYDDLMKGGELSFENTTWADIMDQDILSTSVVTNSSKYLTAPVIVVENSTFEKQTMVTIQSQNSSSPLYYEILPEIISYNKQIKIIRKKYIKPFKVKSGCTVTAYYINKNGDALYPKASAELHKYPNNYIIDIKSKPSPQYFAGGNRGLLDGQLGPMDWRKGGWHGYQGQDFVAIVDVMKSQKFLDIHCTFLEDQRSWIFFPIAVEIYGSNNNVDFELISVDSSENRLMNRSFNDVIYRDVFIDLVSKPFRYYKLVIKNYGPLPKGHPGAGYPAYIFIDEIEFVK